MTPVVLETMRETLLALAAKCEQADRSDRALDKLIGVAVGLPVERDVYETDIGYMSPRGWRVLPHYTASIDAALTLVPDQATWSLGYEFVERHPFAAIVCRHGDGTKLEKVEVAGARSACLALCAAALRARASLTQENP